MAFETNNIYNNPTANGCLMDTDKASLEDNPTSTLSDSWLDKDYTNAEVSVVGTGFASSEGKLTFSACQTVSNKTVEINVIGHYKATFSGSIGGMGQTDHTVELTGMCPSGQYVNIKDIQVMCSTDDQGIAVTACLIKPADGVVKSNAVQFRTINWDSASATQTRTFDVYITVFAEITNSDDVNGLGRLFPNVTIGG